MWLALSRSSEESAKLEQLRAAEAGFIKEAGGLVETVVGRVKVKAIKNLKDLERERTKATKAKRKLKLQVRGNHTHTLDGRQGS